ncbi:MAG TPA: hypothetical protein PLV21_11505 [Cyclobacteriaceae bacterium]|nr:hypothetical protein [Cyclobacteriaceae bacterium]HRJ82507.1 hypothetical protein [Cyclobacteriaceae bacterium]
MKTVLAVIVNFGSEQNMYLQQVVTALKAIQNYNVTVVVNSNVPLPEISGIDKLNVIERTETFFGLSKLIFKIDKRKWNKKVFDYNLLPMTCRQVIDQESENFDYFIFTENDHLWLEHHIRGFAGYEAILPENRIAGLIQYEDYDNDTDGRYYPAYHGPYDWDYNSVEEYAAKKFAHFTNVHQGSFIISRHQLSRIKAQHDFYQFISNDKYSIKCKVNTDLYQYCGMKKVICISEFEQNLIHHLPNIYTTGKLGRNKLGSDDIRMRAALQRLMR